MIARLLPMGELTFRTVGCSVIIAVQHNRDGHDISAGAATAGRVCATDPVGVHLYASRDAKQWLHYEPLPVSDEASCMRKYLRAAASSTSRL
jgi:hypothetical protein